MRRKKRYVLVKDVSDVREHSKDILFQNECGYVLRISPKEAERLRPFSLLISGSIRKLKACKNAK